MKPSIKWSSAFYIPHLKNAKTLFPPVNDYLRFQQPVQFLSYNFVYMKRTMIYLGKILLLAVIYHLTVRVGLSMAFVQANTSPVWPPTGIAIAALLIFGIEL
jgi:hypothetical protein